jgi:hypothetical protein
MDTLLRGTESLLWGTETLMWGTETLLMYGYVTARHRPYCEGRIPYCEARRPYCEARIRYYEAWIRYCEAVSIRWPPETGATDVSLHERFYLLAQCLFQYAISPERRVISDLGGESTCGPGWYVAGQAVWRRCSGLPFSRGHHVVQHGSTSLQLSTEQWNECDEWTATPLKEDQR